MLGVEDMETKNERLENTTKTLKKIAFALIGLFIIGIIVLIALEMSYKSKFSRDKLNLDQFIVFTFTDELGKTNTGKDRVTYLDNIDNIKRIFLRIDENFTNEWMVNGAIRNTIQVMNKLTKDEEFLNMPQDGISVQWVIPTIDAYGNEGEDVGVIITIMKEDFQKIQWDTVTTDGIKKVAYTFWVSDLLKE